MVKICIISWGGIGDAICVTPSIRALKHKYSNSIIVLIHPTLHFPIYKNNPFIDYLYDRESLTAKLLIKDSNYFDVVYNTIDCNLVSDKMMKKEIIGEKLNVDVKQLNNEIFLEDEELECAKNIVAEYNNPIQFQPFSKGNEKKNWFINRWQELIKRNNQFSFLQVGLADETYISGCIDLRGKLSIRESIALQKYCKLFIGVDSFLNHATNFTRTKGVIIFGRSRPKIWGYKENVNISTDNCYCGTMHQCNKNFQCLNEITVNEVDRCLKQAFWGANHK